MRRRPSFIKRALLAIFYFIALPTMAVGAAQEYWQLDNNADDHVFYGSTISGNGIVFRSNDSGVFNGLFEFDNQSHDGVVLYAGRSGIDPAISVSGDIIPGPATFYANVNHDVFKYIETFNTSAGTSAGTGFLAGNSNNGTTVVVAINGTGRAGSGVTGAGNGVIQMSNVGSSGELMIDNTSTTVPGGITFSIGNSPTWRIIPSDGSLNAFVKSASAAPPAGQLSCWGDSTDKNLKCINASSSVAVTAQPIGVTVGQCLNGMTADGAFSTTACGAGGGGGGGGTVTSVTVNDPLSVTNPTTNPDISLNLAADMTVTAHLLTQADYPLVSRSTNAPANAVNMGALASGVNEQTTAGGTATPLTYAAVPGDVQYGAASNGGLAQNSSLFFDGTNFGVGTAGSPQSKGHFKATSTPANGILAVENTASGVGDYAELDLINDLGFGFRSSWYMTSSTYTGTGKHSAVILQNAGGPLGFQGSGAASIGMWITKNGAGVPGDVQIARLSAGGMTKAIATTDIDGRSTGQLAIAVAGTDYQAPLTACTDYVSLSCVTGATDLGGTNATPTVIGAENDAAMRGDLLATAVSAPATPAAGKARIYVDSGSKNIAVKNDAGTVNHGIQTNTCAASRFMTAVGGDGSSTCNQASFSGLTGSWTCAQADGVFKIYDGGSCGGTAFTTSGSFVPGQPLIATAGNHIATNDICSVIPAVPTACGSTTTTGSSGSYVASIVTDNVGRTTAITTQSAPLASALVYTLASSSLAMGQNQSTLVMPLPAGAPIINTAAAGVALSTTLSANWGSSSQSPPTFFAPIGSIKCTGDITFYSLTGIATATLVAAVWYVTGNAFLPGSWHSLASQSIALSVGSGSGRTNISVSASSTIGLVPNDASLVFVFYRSDANAGTTLNTLNAQVVCALGG